MKPLTYKKPRPTISDQELERALTTITVDINLLTIAEAMALYRKLHAIFGAKT